MSKEQATDQATVFPDSNILLHFKPLAEIDWRQICNAKQVKLVICLQVINEVDDKKGDARLSERAKRAIKDIQELRNKEFRPGVTLVVSSNVLRTEDFPATMSPDRCDDRIVRSLQVYIDAHPDDVPAFVVTDDYGMELRCEAHRVGVVKLPQDYRLKSPHDEQIRKLQQAQKELVTLKNRLPDFFLHVTAKGDYPTEETCTDLQPIEQIKMLDVDQVLDIERQQHSKIGGSGHSLIGASFGNMLYQPDQVERYNRELGYYFECYEKYLHQFNEWVSRQGLIYQFDLYLTNNGSIQGNRIEVDVLFPQHVHRLLKSSRSHYAFGPPPTPPEPPKKPTPFSLAPFTPKTLSSILSQLPTVNSPNFVRTGHNVQLPNPFAPSVEIENYDDETGATLRCRLKELMHTKHKLLGSFSLVFLNKTDVKNFQADCSVLSAELPTTTHRQLLFKFKVQNV